MVVNCIRDIFQKKDYIETLQKIEMLLLVMNFSKYLKSFSCDLDQFKLETQLKTLTHVFDGKQIGIRYNKNISLIASQKLFLYC